MNICRLLYMKKQSAVYSFIIFTSLLFLSFLSQPVSALAPGADESNADYKYDRGFLVVKQQEFINEHGDLAIKKFRIKGLKKTRRSLVLNQTKTEPGQSLSEFNPHGFVNRLQRRNIFSDIELSYIAENDMAVIEISLEEKWTFIPLPVFYRNSYDTVYGIYILESNLLGYGKTLFTGGTGSSLGWNGILGYVDPEFLSSDFKMNLFLSYKNQIYQNGDVHGEIRSEYQAAEYSVRTDIGYGFGDSFTLFLSGGYQSYSVHKNYEDSLNPPDSLKYRTGSVIIDVRRLDYYEYFYYGFTGRVEAGRSFPADSEFSDFNTFELRTRYALRLFSYNRVSFDLRFFTGDIPDIAMERPAGSSGFRTLPAEIIVSDRYASGTVSFERPFLRYGWGAVTLLAFWEQGAFRDNIDTYYFYGPGGGVLVYLKRIAFPALGFNYAVNLKTGNGEFSVSAGFAF